MSQKICTGDGSCLEQTDCKNGYKKYDTVSCSHDCQPIKCPNYLVCGTLNPKWLIYSYEGICGTPCLRSLGHLQFFEDKDCPICLETKTSVRQVNCDHTICVDCFKRCHLPPYWNDSQPEFPYDSDIEDQYEEDMDDELWKNDPLIQKYEEDLMKWEVERQEKEESESYLKVCSLCRE